MKNFPMPLAILVLVFLIISLTGCKSPGGNATVGPGLLRLGVSTTAGYSLMQNPHAAPGVRAGTEIICATAHGTNVTPAAIVAALDAHGSHSIETVFILNAAIGAYSIAFNSLDNPDKDAGPYALAVCDGLNDALLYTPAFTPVPRARTVTARPVTVPEWPQVKFKFE